jgi:membrane associated rhomboid family serine protease
VSYQQIRPGRFDVLPPVIKNLMIINGLFLLAQKTTEMWGMDQWVTDYLALHNVASPLFRPHQLITHLFLHGDFFHFFFNMFALWMFGNLLENLWGPKRFLIFYFSCGFGAAALHLITLSLEYYSLQSQVAIFLTHSTPQELIVFLKSHPAIYRFISSAYIAELVNNWMSFPKDINYIDQAQTLLRDYQQLSLDVPTVGASGAVFGALAAFGFLFPNTYIYIYFFFPIKAKWFVILYAGAELWMGVRNSGGNVAHFAHLGGALIGFLLVWYWNKKKRQTFY